MKGFYDAVKAQLPAFGRRAEDCRILTAIMPFVAATHAEAERKRDAHNALVHPLVGLSTLASHSNIDFSQHQLDAPLANVHASGTQGLFAAVMRLAQEQGRTLREIGTLYGQGVLVPQITGTATEIANYMQAIIEAEADVTGSSFRRRSCRTLSKSSSTMLSRSYSGAPSCARTIPAVGYVTTSRWGLREGLCVWEMGCATMATRKDQPAHRKGWP